MSRSLGSSTSPPLVGERIAFRALWLKRDVEVFLLGEAIKLFSFLVFAVLYNVPPRRT